MIAMVLVDPSTSTLPESVESFNTRLMEITLKEPHNQAAPEHSGSGDFESVGIPTSYALERWDIKAHAYSEQHAGSISLLGKLFGGSASSVQAGVIHDAKRFSIDQTDDGTRVEIGVAVRLAVATEKIDGSFDLTLPNLAANAQLNKSNTRVGISVIGYSGHLVGVLPSPSQLNMDSYIEYVEAFKKIQELVFGQEGFSNIVPTVISYSE